MSKALFQSERELQEEKDLEVFALVRIGMSEQDAIRYVNREYEYDKAEIREDLLQLFRLTF